MQDMLQRAGMSDDLFTIVESTTRFCIRCSQLIKDDRGWYVKGAPLDWLTVSC
jgi:hypothetical protein